MKHYIFDTNALLRHPNILKTQIPNARFAIPQVVLQEYRLSVARKSSLSKFSSLEEEISKGSVTLIQTPNVPIKDLSKDISQTKKSHIGVNDYLIAHSVQDYQNDLDKNANQIFFVSDDVFLGKYVAEHFSVQILRLNDYLAAVDSLHSTNLEPIVAENKIEQLENDLESLKKIVANLANRFEPQNLVYVPSFVDESRIQELRDIKSAKFDLSRLIELCKELNKNYSASSYLSTAILLRSILDHVPPIFECANFAEVANNYAGGSKSFKQNMSHLHNSLRKIADAYLHEQIRKKESLPNKTQVNFAPDLDTLLGEIVRVLK